MARMLCGTNAVQSLFVLLLPTFQGPAQIPPPYEALCDSPERHNQPLSEMPLFEVFSCLSLLRFELLEGKDLSYLSFQAPYTVSSSGRMK